MNSSIVNVSEILSKESINSAGFSTGYSFDEVNASEFFDNLVENSTYSSPIFSGIIIMEKSGDTFTIIDGLQRITTINLLLCALCERYKNTSKKNDEAKDKIMKRFLTFDGEPKLNLLSDEQKIYKKILFNQKLTKNELNSNLVKTYNEFLDRIKKHRISGTELFKIISKIQFMMIMIEDSEVPIRELYQALNNNKDKPQINLISDFITQKDAEAGLGWMKVVNKYKGLGDQTLIENFMVDFLTIQNDGKIPSKNTLYNNFKSYYIKISKYLTTEIIIDNMCKYAQNYLKIVKSNFDDFQIKKQLIVLNENNGQDAYPYLMEVMDDLDNGHINKEVFSDILTMINSFVLNRQEESFAEVSIDFESLSKELNKMLVLKNYVPKIIDESKLTINEINNSSTL
jgi:uncharacterized protein with ParB-like and HNH nuclease domain